VREIERRRSNSKRELEVRIQAARVAPDERATLAGRHMIELRL
jgi:hypothetical protein